MAPDQSAEAPMATEMPAPVVANQPLFVVLEDHFGWQENGITMMFKKNQVVKDRTIIAQLLSRGAPLLQGAA